jgi:hypothetical protein
MQLRIGQISALALAAAGFLYTARRCLLFIIRLYHQLREHVS